MAGNTCSIKFFRFKLCTAFWPPKPPQPLPPLLTACNEDKKCEAGWICSYSLSLLTPTGGTCVERDRTCHTNTDCPQGQTCLPVLAGQLNGRAPGLCRISPTVKPKIPKPPRGCPRFQPKPLSKCPPLLQGATCHYTEYTDRADLAIRMDCQIGRWQKIWG